ncbi:MAG: ABC transporter ATP-binding protein [Acidimicrobiia bacterium]
MAEIRLEGLAKRYGRTEAVRGIDLEIPDGRFTVLVGPSGCGKTTTLRMIAGLVDPTSGRIWIGGRDVTLLEPKERDVAMVFQNYALYPHLRVYDNIAFGLRARSVDRREIDRRVRGAAELLGATDLLDRKPGQLSGGQQQRVAIGRAIVREPAAFLLDEPLSNLDAKLRSDTRTEILRIQRELQATVVYVTHDQEEAMALADEIVVMREGGIEQRGTPSEVYAGPATEFVGTFIGSPTMNVIPGRMEDGRFVSPDLVIGGLSGAGGEARLGVRPDHIHPTGTLEPSHASEPFRATVEVVEPLGPRAVVTLRAGDLRLRAVVEGRTLSSIREGQEREFAIERHAVHLFPPE